MDKLLKNLFPFICVLAASALAFLKPEAKEIQLSIITAGATAYQQEKTP